MTIDRPLFNDALTNYTADEFRNLAAAVWSAPGVVGGASCAPAASNPVGMSITVGVGPFVLPSKSGANGFYVSRIRAAETATIQPAQTQPRIDVVCLTVLDTKFGDASDGVVVNVVKGTAAASPAVPAVPAASIPIAQVSVGANVTSIAAANITDLRQRATSAQLPPVYVNEAARDAAITNPAAGQRVYLTAPTGAGGVGSYEYVGGAWVSTKASPRLFVTFALTADVTQNAPATSTVTWQTTLANVGSFPTSGSIYLGTPSAGMYRVTCNVSIAANGAGNHRVLHVYVNGTEDPKRAVGVTTNNQHNMQLLTTFDIKLNAGDSVSVAVQNDASSGNTTVIQAGSFMTLEKLS